MGKKNLFCGKKKIVGEKEKHCYQGKTPE